MTESNPRAAVLQAMGEYANAIRGDWSDFDGRTEKIIINDWVRELRNPDPTHDIAWYRRDLGICKSGGGHWDHHCGPIQGCGANDV